MKVPSPPDSGKDLAEHQGCPFTTEIVLTRGESGGRCRQISDLTNRNQIGGYVLGVRPLTKSKPNNCTELGIVNLVGTWNERGVMVLGEISSADGSLSESVSNNE